MQFLVGFLIGALCGAIPLLLGLLTNHKVLGIVGISVSALSGIVFVLLDKSAFIAIGIAAVFAIFTFASHKKKNQIHDDDEHHDFDS